MTRWEIVAYEFPLVNFVLASYHNSALQSIQAPYGKASIETKRTYANNNISFKTIDKASGLVNAEHDVANLKSNHCDCGAPGRNVEIPDEISVNFNVVIRRNADSPSTVSVSTFFKPSLSRAKHKTEPLKSTPSPIECISTGHWEKAILDDISG